MRSHPSQWRERTATRTVNLRIVRRYFFGAPPLVIGAYILCYVLLDWISYIFPAIPTFGITLWNPPPGLSLALLLRFGPQCAPWVLFATMAAEVLVRGMHFGPVLFLVVSFLPTLVYSGLAALLTGPFRLNADFTSRRDAALFVAASAIASAVLALIVVGVASAAGLLDTSRRLSALAEFWIGDWLGILVTTPLLLVYSRRPRPRLATGKLEVSIQMFAITLTIAVIFGSGLAQELKLFYLLFLPMIWIGMRHGVEGTVVAAATVQVGIILAMLAQSFAAAAVLEFQFLLLSVALTGLFLGLAVSERRDASEQLRVKQEELDRSLRLAGASEIASALAHELNQPLFAIDSYVGACQMMLADQGTASHRVRGTFDKVAAEVKHASEIVRKLRAFYRSGTTRRVPTGVRAILDSAVESSEQRFARHGIEWQVQCPAALRPVQVDRVQIDMVLHNLIANAIDALKQISTGSRKIMLSASPQDGRAMRISVADNGPGIPAEMEGRLFDAFASGKPDGMGLGLAISRSIVEAHGGRLWFQRTESGTVFHVDLPTTETPA